MRFPPLVVLLCAGGLSACRASSLLVRDDSAVELARTTIAAENPAERGSHGVRFLYYGSGTDRNRAVYRDSVTIRTRAVNGTPFLRGGDPKRLKARWDYWGFDEKRLPVNARVWYPDGPGPFPLVLIVHGNHDMRKFSDPGYAYLGEHLASRGFILASVDENFLNGDLRNENGARGWMLLQHLTNWRRWAADSTSPFYRKVDLSRIALIGHSRGGEAVSLAAAFNRLSRFPDDARVTFDFGFDIRSVVALAPVDGDRQYKPEGKGTPLENVNYLVLHGTHDSDVQTFMGLRQYQRVRFTDGGDWFKAALYIYRANHGQFNTTWGSSDVGDSGWLLARDLLLPGDEQRQVAKVFITGFLEATLHGKREYLPMFRDHRVAGGWLPKTIYLSRFEAPTARMLADYEDDIDVTTASAAGVRISGRRLATWKETGLTMRSRGLQPFNNTVVMLGWTSPRDSAAAATYSLALPDTLAAAWKLSARSSVIFSLANAGARPRPLSPADTAAPGDDGAGPATSSAPAPASASSASPDTARDAGGGLDFSVQLVLADGRVASVPLSTVAPIRPPLTVRLWKYTYVEKRLNPPSKDHDDVLASYAIPMSAFTAAIGPFEPRDVRALRFRFDRGPAGTILLDDVGFDVGEALSGHP
jgi:dienelactone hydrolase